MLLGEAEACGIPSARMKCVLSDLPLLRVDTVCNMKEEIKYSRTSLSQIVHVKRSQN